MSKMVFMNMPVKDIERSKKFYTALGYSFDTNFTDENAASVIISDTVRAHLLAEPMFQTFTTKQIADSQQTAEVLIAVSADSKQEVDDLADKALASGGSKAMDPQDHGWMYLRSFLDPDGHHWEVAWMDPNAEM